jgi:nicotinate-nucleotide adenylyltransferase
MSTQEIKVPAVKQKAHVGILGGTFDPPHLCHELLAVSFLSLEPIDELWVIPCANHAFKLDLSTAFSHRLAMCQRAMKHIRTVRVLDIESKLPTPSYTIETLTTIKKVRPDIELTLCLGSDLLDSFHEWQRAKDLAQMVKIAIFERTSYPITRLPDLLKNAQVHSGYLLPDTNSTRLRELLQNRDASIRHFLDYEVVEYIEEHGLY